MQAIIISRRDFRENDQIISLYTLEHGKVEALARGVKKILSKNSAALEPFCFVEAEIIPGKKDLAHLGSVTPVNIFKNIRTNLQKSLMAGYVVKLLDKLIHPNEPDKRIFELLKSWLEWLDAASVIPVFAGLTIDAFVVKLFYFLGFDITKAENIPLSARRAFTCLLKEKWGASPVDKDLHAAIYRFAVYHSEKKLGNWN